MTPANHWTTWEVPHSNTAQYLHVQASKKSMNAEMKLQASLHCTLCQFRKWIHVHAFAETRTYEVSLTLLSSSSMLIKSYLFHLLSCAFFAEGRGVDIISFVIFTPLCFLTGI